MLELQKKFGVAVKKVSKKLFIFYRNSGYTGGIYFMVRYLFTRALTSKYIQLIKLYFHRNTVGLRKNFRLKVNI